MRAGRWTAAGVAVVLAAGLATTLGPVDPVTAAPMRSPAIVNGNPAPAGSLPFVVSILERDRIAADGPWQAQYCAGALTTPTTVVTAAHCVVNQKSPQRPRSSWASARHCAIRRHASST